MLGRIHTGSGVGATRVRETNPYNLVKVLKAEDLQGMLSDLDCVIAIGGYPSKTNGFSEIVPCLLEALVDWLISISKRVGLVTNPLIYEGGNGGITTCVAQERGLSLVYLVEEANVNKIADSQAQPHEGVVINWYLKQKKYVLPQEEYARAIALISNSLLVCGGGPGATGYFVEAIKKGNKVVLFQIENFELPAWDLQKNEPAYAPDYLETMLFNREGNRENLPLFSEKGLDADFLTRYESDIVQNVRAFTVSSLADVPDVAESIAEFLIS